MSECLLLPRCRFLISLIEVYGVSMVELSSEGYFSRTKMPTLLRLSEPKAVSQISAEQISTWNC